MRLNYKKLGAGQPLFILHGLFGMLDNWGTIGKILSEHFEVYLVDLRNHGSSPHNDDCAFPVLANDIKELMEDVKKLRSDENTSSISHLPSAILMGHSIGGKVAMQCASLYPELLKKLIVVDIAPKEYLGKQFDFIEKLLLINLAELKTRKEAESVLMGIGEEMPVVQLLLKNIKRDQDDKLAWKFNLKVIANNQNTIGKTFNLKDKIDTPTLFIRGEKSDYILDSDMDEIKRIFSNVEMATLRGAGHWLHAEKPEEFAAAVKNFIA